MEKKNEEIQEPEGATDVVWRCLPLKAGVKQLDQRPEVLAKTPLAYEVGTLEHPAIPGLMLSLDERLYGVCLELVDPDSGETRLESVQDKGFRIRWKKPVPMTKSATTASFVTMDMELFKKKKEELKSRYHPDNKIAREAKQKLQNEKAAAQADKAQHMKAEIEAAERADEAQRAEAAAIAAQKAKEEKEAAAAAAAEAMTGLAKLRDCQTATLAMKDAKQENKDSTDSEKSHRRNLESRLASVLSSLQSLIDDLEVGEPFGELRILAGKNLEEEIEIMRDEIALLRRAIQISKGCDL